MVNGLIISTIPLLNVLFHDSRFNLPHLNFKCDFMQSRCNSEKQHFLVSFPKCQTFRDAHVFVSPSHTSSRVPFATVFRISISSAEFREDKKEQPGIFIEKEVEFKLGHISARFGCNRHHISQIIENSFKNVTAMNRRRIRREMVSQFNMFMRTVKIKLTQIFVAYFV